MNQNSAVNIVSRNAKVTTKVPNNSYVSRSLPFRACIKLLIQITFETKRSNPNLAVE